MSMISKAHRLKISSLKREYEQLRVGKEALLKIIQESELPELVYNSNAIENSTLTLKETERILLELEVARMVSVRESFEAKNLARVIEYLSGKQSLTIDSETIMLLHRMLIGAIDDSIAGRFRKAGEFVRVGSHIAPAPELVDGLIGDAIIEYKSSLDKYSLERVSRFHLEFERIHPFNDGNGRIGRVLINAQLAENGLPPIIIRNKSKKDVYYPAFVDYVNNGSTLQLDLLMSLSVMESLHKRLAYLKSQNIIKLSEYAKKSDQSLNTLLNAARRQSIPAFREKGIWKIGQ